MNKQITDIVKRLTEASKAYYGGQPIMSDAAYDALEDELRKLDPNHPHLTKVGTAATSGWQKVKHGRPMASLNKAQTEADFDAWATSCGHRAGELLIVMDKLDGASLNVEYVNGRFVRAVTRGDGDVGEDITVNAKLMNFPKVIPGNWSGSLRGEVIVRYQAFKDNFPGQSNPRNTANGTMKRQSDSSGCGYLDVVMFDVMPEIGDQDAKSEQFKQLQVWGFSVPRWQVLNSIDDVLALYEEYQSDVIHRDDDGQPLLGDDGRPIVLRKSIRSKVEEYVPGDGRLDYDIDGLVIQFNDPQRFEGLGSQGRGPKGAVAYKFSHEEKETILRGIEWQVGNSGRITPVAIFDEVDFAGARIKRASLAGVRQVAHLRLFEDCRILVSRRNGVIPRVEANLEFGIINDG